MGRTGATRRPRSGGRRNTVGSLSHRRPHCWFRCPAEPHRHLCSGPANRHRHKLSCRRTRLGSWAGLRAGNINSPAGRRSGRIRRCYPGVGGMNEPCGEGRCAGPAHLPRRHLTYASPLQARPDGHHRPAETDSGAWRRSGGPTAIAARNSPAAAARSTCYALLSAVSNAPAMQPPSLGQPSLSRERNSIPVLPGQLIAPAPAALLGCVDKSTCPAPWRGRAGFLRSPPLPGIEFSGAASLRAGNHSQLVGLHAGLYQLALDLAWREAHSLCP